MRRIVAPILAALAVGLLSPPAPACTFCAGGAAGRQTLREHFSAAKVAVAGKLRNAKVDASGVGGTTEFHVEAVLKADPTLPVGRVIILPRYYPLVGDTPTEYVLFGAVVEGKLDPVFGVAGSRAVTEYLQASAKLAAADTTRRLGFAFGHLDSTDATVSDDAFLQFAKATDAELLKAKSALDPAKLRKWLADPNTPADRLGVFGLLLGIAGGPADAKALAEFVAGPPPLPERVAGNLGGLFAGLTMLDPKAGWAAIDAALADANRPFNERLAAVGTVRFFQSTRPDAKPAVLACYRTVIRQGDLADLAIDDLRRWAWWELTTEVLAKAETTPAPPPVVRRGVLRYALACPQDEAKRFVAAARTREPKLVADVEETLRMYERK